ncbi:MAG TPA: allantoinase AllB [Jatrophihabitans sp.]|nr:allantoinase AllB [Jatrophihabitans sp.]
MAFDLVVRAGRAVIAGGEAGCALGIRGGRIAAIAEFDAPLNAMAEVRLADDEVLLPGLVDTHVHVNEPGRTSWEGFATATAAAAAGGVTTIVDMPLNSIPPTCDVSALEAKRARAATRCAVDVGFWGGAIPGNLAELKPLHEAGVVGFKCFLLPSGVEEFPPLDQDGLLAAMREIASFDGLLVAHAEDGDAIREAPADRAYRSFLASRPDEAEGRAIGMLLDAARRTGCRTHVVHLSSAATLPMLAEARAEGLPVTVETCPHYLTFAAEEIPDGATEFKCCPPIRDRANRELLWQGLREGLIDCVVSDHSPCLPELKRIEAGDFGAAWGGIASLQLGLPAVWTQARDRDVPLAELAGWLAERPAALAGLSGKGKLAVGADADLCVFAPDEWFVVEPAKLKQRHPMTPYAGRRLSGVVRRTWLRGRQITGRPAGRLLNRGGL